LLGPHRDDVEFLMDGRSARFYGSQGQSRTLAIAFKLAQVDYLASHLNDPPLFLLDDVLSELDLERRGRLVEELSAVNQTILSMTNLEDWSSLGRRKSAAWVFEMEPGKPVSA